MVDCPPDLNFDELTEGQRECFKTIYINEVINGFGLKVNMPNLDKRSYTPLAARGWVDHSSLTDAAREIAQKLFKPEAVKALIEEQYHRAWMNYAVEMEDVLRSELNRLCGMELNVIGDVNNHQWIVYTDDHTIDVRRKRGSSNGEYISVVQSKIEHSDDVFAAHKVLQIAWQIKMHLEREYGNEPKPEDFENKALFHIYGEAPISEDDMQAIWRQ